MEVQIDAKTVNELRKRTGVGLMDCKKALKESVGDMEAAVELLKKKGLATAAKKADREANEGVIESYIHFGGKVGVMVEINCETDFVAKNEDFKQFSKDVCMHIAAVAPICVSRKSIPEEELSRETEVAKAQTEGKPAEAVESIIKGKIDKWCAQVCLLDQPFVKDSTQTVQEVLTAMISKLGENIVINRFTRFQIGY